jgi:nitrogen fixation protein NifU and related proteins
MAAGNKSMNEDLYQDQIIEWSKKTKHTLPMEQFHCRCTVNNPLCGDRISVELQLDGEKIKTMAYQIKGCLLSKASSAILAEFSGGLTLAQLIKLGSDLDQALKSSSDDTECFPEWYRLFYPVRSHKSRHPCVLLPFDAVIKAISEYKSSLP